ncbi:T-cell surface glycoprotein CD5 [Fukomys damarensis]|uniref:T-cell surface glycoprotein CD5 n=1 Tax=Fukomys damarensis TaxID=885580 RepID=A0A091E302_FUKDA|nr:T-cell surface glycoprotein CD5 [Fukomys damarensis]
MSSVGAGRPRRAEGHPGRPDAPPSTATGFKVRLEGSSSQCQGRLQVYAQDSWSTVCAQSWGLQGSSPPGPGQASHLCRQLHCGDICRLGTVPAFNAPQPRLRQVICRGPPGSFSNCSSIRTQSWCQPLALVCLAPPRLRMVAGPGGLQCAGAIEFYSSHWGGAVGYEAREDESAGLGTLVCGNLGCGSFLKWLPEPQWTVVQWTVQDTSCEALPQCFRRALPGAASPALALVCSVPWQSSHPSLRPLGAAQVQLPRSTRQEGPASCSTPHPTVVWSLPCPQQSTWEELEMQSPEPYLSSDGGREGPLSNVVIGVASDDMAGPETSRSLPRSLSFPTHREDTAHLMTTELSDRKWHRDKGARPVRQKKQRQWIGPTGMSQTMSFHRNPTATVRAQPENHPREHADNEYSQPPRNSRLSAYPALEGALRLSAAQPDNSSDSDYDLHATHRL